MPVKTNNVSGVLATELPPVLQQFRQDVAITHCSAFEWNTDGRQGLFHSKIGHQRPDHAAFKCCRLLSISSDDVEQLVTIIGSSFAVDHYDTIAITVETDAKMRAVRFHCVYQRLRMNSTTIAVDVQPVGMISDEHDFGTKLIDLGPMFYVSSLNILPLVMVVLSILHTRNMPKPADDQQAQQMKMMKWMPIIFAVILYNYTAALAMYMVLSSTVAIIESKIVRAKDDHDQEAAPAKA